MIVIAGLGLRGREIIFFVKYSLVWFAFEDSNRTEAEDTKETQQNFLRSSEISWKTFQKYLQRPKRSSDHPNSVFSVSRYCLHSFIFLSLTVFLIFISFFSYLNCSGSSRQCHRALRKVTENSWISMIMMRRGQVETWKSVKLWQHESRQRKMKLIFNFFSLWARRMRRREST